MLCPVTFHRRSKGWVRPGASWESADLEGEPVSAQEEEKQRDELLPVA